MKVNRSGKRSQSRPLLWGCGCATLMVILSLGGVIIALLLLPNLVPRVALEVAGFENVGDTETILAADATPAPALAERRSVADTLTVSVGGFQQILSSSGTGYSAQIGSNNGVQELQITVDENGLLTLCRQYTMVCSPTGEQGVRNVSFDIRSGGGVLRGDFQLQAGVWQSAGIVVRVLDNQRVEITGVELDGQVYTAGQSDFAAQINEGQTIINQNLPSASVNIGGQTYQLRAIYPENGRVTLVLR